MSGTEAHYCYWTSDPCTETYRDMLCCVLCDVLCGLTWNAFEVACPLSPYAISLRVCCGGTESGCVVLRSRMHVLSAIGYAWY
eukprot:3377842-Rhodomonas_salina.1